MTLETMLISAVSALAGTVVGLWSYYIIMQNKKDADIQKERDRADRLLSEQQARFDKELSMERADCKEILEYHINHYEQMLQVLKDRYNLDPKKLEEETNKTKRVSMSESQITKITESMRKKLDDSKEREPNG